MSTSTIATDEVNPLDRFRSECLLLGSIKGLAYFRSEIRGREEVLVTIHCHAVDVSARTRTTLPSIENGLPPASPAANESQSILFSSEGSVFLIGAYSSYSAPYCWLRTRRSSSANSPTLLYLPGTSATGSAPVPLTGQSQDWPLKLFTTEAWRLNPHAVHVWHVLSELLSMHKAPVRSYLEDADRLLTTLYERWENGRSAYTSLENEVLELLKEVCTAARERQVAASAFNPFRVDFGAFERAMLLIRSPGAISPATPNPSSNAPANLSTPNRSGSLSSTTSSDFPTVLIDILLTSAALIEFLRRVLTSNYGTEAEKQVTECIEADVFQLGTLHFALLPYLRMLREGERERERDGEKRRS